MNTKFKTKYLIIIFCLFTFPVFTQWGSNDASFNSFNAGEYGLGFNPSSVLRTSCVQADGKIIVGGSFSSFNLINNSNIVRLNSNGSLDLTFDSGTGFNGTVETICIQTDGKIIVGGYFTGYNGVVQNRISRLNSDGSLDLSFNIGTGLNGQVISSKVQPDGKIIIGGSFSIFNGTICQPIIRLNSDGSLDLSFNAPLSLTSTIESISIQTDGKLIIGGDFNEKILRLNTNGTLDASFNTGTSFNASVYTTSIQADGKILVGGSFSSFNGVNREKIARLNGDGSLDNTFSVGSGFNNIVSTINIQNDGNLIIGGGFTSFDLTPANYLIRLNSDGSNDLSFNIGSGFNEDVESTTILSDGRIFVIGLFNFFNDISRGKNVLLNVDGSKDITFNASSEFDNAVYTSSIQDNGKIIYGGEFSTFQATSVNKIARLNFNGSIDTTFNIGSGFNGNVYTIKIQNDGKILVGGEFTSYNGQIANQIVRLNIDGTIDLSFNTGTGFNGNISTSIIQQDGKIILGGYFTEYNGNIVNSIVRLNIDGSYDGTFNTGTGFNGNIYTSKIQQDGKVILGGVFTEFNGIPTSNIIRLNSNGAIDLGFNTYFDINLAIYSLEVLNNGKILVGGDFTRLTYPCQNFTCLNPDGSPDENYNQAFSMNGSVRSISIQSADKIIVAGEFTSFNGLSSPRIISLYSTGIVDANFNVGNGFNGAVFTTQIQDDGYVLVGGDFNLYDWNGQSNINRIVNCNATTSIALHLVCDSLTWIDGNTYYSSTNSPYFTLTNSNGCDSIINLNLTIITSTTSSTNAFSNPSSSVSCTGQLAITTTGNPDFEMSIDGSAPFISSGYSLQSNLCPGIHELTIVSSCNDTLMTQFVIPVDSNFIFNNPFIDSIAVDSLGTSITNCDIYYNSIDTAYIDSLWATGNQVNVIWNIVDSNGSNLDTTTYDLMNGSGVYWLQLSVFCPTKAVDDYFAVTQAIYFGNGGAYLVSLEDNPDLENSIGLYPNPTSNSVTITFTSNSIARVQLIDAQGKFIQESTIKSGDQISLDYLDRGVYFLNVEMDGKSICKKIIKQ